MQQHVQLQDNHQIFGIGCSTLILGPSIAALVIGLQYDSNSTCNETDYLMDLKHYLIIAGSVSIIWSLLSCFVVCCGAICCSDFTRNKIESLIFILFSCPMLIWSLVWSIFGLFIYGQQMSTQCQNEPIGQMIVAWCVIQIIFIAAALCIIVIPICILCITFLFS
eukprot:72849_1